MEHVFISAVKWPSLPRARPWSQLQDNALMVATVTPLIRRVGSFLADALARCHCIALRRRAALQCAVITAKNLQTACRPKNGRKVIRNCAFTERVFEIFVSQNLLTVQRDFKQGFNLRYRQGRF